MDALTVYLERWTPPADGGWGGAQEAEVEVAAAAVVGPCSVLPSIGGQEEGGFWGVNRGGGEEGGSSQVLACCRLEVQGWAGWAVPFRGSAAPPSEAWS